MTTGSIRRDRWRVYPQGRDGGEDTIDWWGQDRPPRAKSASVTKLVYYREVPTSYKGKDPRKRVRLKKFSIRQDWRSAEEKKGKSTLDEPHEYWKLKQELRDHWGLIWPGPGNGYEQKAMMLFAADPNWNNSSGMWTANDQIKLINKLYEKVVGPGSDFNMSVFLGEGNQCLNMIADSGVRIAKSIFHLRQGDITGAARSLLQGTGRKPLPKHDWVIGNNRGTRAAASNEASNWLQLQYGWLPLVQDMHGAAEQLAWHLSVPQRKVYKASRLVKRYGSKRTSSGLIQPDGHGFFSVTAKSSQFWRQSITAHISEHPTVAMKLGLQDPELVAWELMPWSFVVDWAIPIGDYLQARANVKRLVGKYQQSVLLKQFAEAPVGRNIVSQWGGDYSTGVNSTRARIWYNRLAITTSLDVPKPKFVGLGEVLSWRRAANAIALLTQLSTKGKT